MTVDFVRAIDAGGHGEAHGKAGNGRAPRGCCEESSGRDACGSTDAATHRHPWRVLGMLLVALSGCLAAGEELGAQSLSAPGRQAGELERIQMHSNRLRGVPYRSTLQPGNTLDPVTFTFKPVRQIALDGDPTTNVGGNVYPIDIAGDGEFGFVHFNGYRVIRAYDSKGVKLWQVDSPYGRVHRSLAHRDTMAVFDTDGDGTQEIVHCWSSGTAQLLVLRDGETGKVRKSTVVPGQPPNSECQLAAFAFEGAPQPRVRILVAGRASTAAGCAWNYADTSSYITAYDVDLSLAWTATTCDAGHYTWPLDADGNGLAEAVFVGKYLYDWRGVRICTLPGFGSDHVDSMVVADLIPSLAGHEVLAVSASHTRLFRAKSCATRWSIPTSRISNAQHAAYARMRDTNGPVNSLIVTTKLNTGVYGPPIYPLITYTLSPLGAVDRQHRETYNDEFRLVAPPIQNANLDGVATSEDRLASFGQVVDAAGKRRLTVDWYWHLQELTADEEEVIDPGTKWTRTPFAFDLDNDGRDELVVWGRRKLVVGTRATP